MAKEEVFPIESAEFSEKEEAILEALYAASDGSYNLYSLSWKLHPEVKVGTDAAEKAFKEVRAATEGLIAKSVVRGKRSTGADGVYFEAMKLTPKGERKAIESKNRLRRIVVSHIAVDEEDKP